MFKKNQNPAIKLFLTAVSVPVFVAACTNATLNSNFFQNNNNNNQVSNVFVFDGYVNPGGTWTLSGPQIFTDPYESWSTTGPNHPLSEVGNPAITFLGNGTLLVAGGYLNGSATATHDAYLYNPNTMTWSATNSMNDDHGGFAIVTIPGGDAVVFGGCVAGCTGNGADGTPFATTEWATERYIVGSGTWSVQANLQTIDPSHPMGNSVGSVVLQNGNVLVCSGSNGVSYNTYCDIFNPSSNTWANTGNLLGTAASGGSNENTEAPMILLPNGNVMFISNNAANWGQVEMYNVGSGTWSATAQPATNRYGILVPLSNGLVVMVGGRTNASVPVANIDIYNIYTNTWSSGGMLPTASYAVQATALNDGNILITGGCTVTNCTSSSNQALIYNPNTQNYMNVPSMSYALVGSFQILMP